MTVFEDWNLVLAAYNSGPGNVRKAIRRSGGKTSYWEIRPFLPRETSAYVPLFHRSDLCDGVRAYVRCRARRYTRLLH